MKSSLHNPVFENLDVTYKHQREDAVAESEREAAGEAS